MNSISERRQDWLDTKARWKNYGGGAWFATKMTLLTVVVLLLLNWATNGVDPYTQLKAYFNPVHQAPTVIVLPPAKPLDATKAWTQYFPPERVWSVKEGFVLLCPAPAEVHASKNCYQGSVDPQLSGHVGGWVYLNDYAMNGFELKDVVMSESGQGPSVQLKWVPQSTK